jgi:hypothetical protein
MSLSKIKHIIPKNIGAIIYIAMIPSNAYAYIDPGSGSIILQIILGGLGGLAILLKLFWRRIISIFPFFKNADDESQEKVKE